MRKITSQGFIILAFFLVMWFALSQVDWMTVLNVGEVTKTTEEKLGNLFWDVFNESGKEIQNKEITLPVDSILSKICISNDIDRGMVKLHIVRSDDINAFVLPNNHLVIFTGLISTSENESEISGVICHELAHMEMGHVMKKLIKEVGLSVLISMATGNGSPGIIIETGKLLSSSAYDRKMEKEADIKAVDYLMESNIDPEHFANFLYRLAGSEPTAGKHLSWISTHPDSKERAEYIIEYSNGKPTDHQAILSQTTWDGLKASLEEL